MRLSAQLCILTFCLPVVDILAPKLTRDVFRLPSVLHPHEFLLLVSVLTFACLLARRVSKVWRRFIPALVWLLFMSYLKQLESALCRSENEATPSNPSFLTF